MASPNKPTTKPTRRILSEHFATIRQKLQEHSRHFDIADHGDIKGYGREVLVQELLSSHLPSQIEYLTGEIIDRFDTRSGQVDIILQSKRYPKIPLLGNLHLAFADSVVAAIEVKSNLTTQHLAVALHQFKRIKSLRRSVILEFSELAAKLNTIPCVLFAFKGPRRKTLIDTINDFAKENKLAPNGFCPDMIVVLDRGYYICKNDGWQFPVIPRPGAFFRDWGGPPGETLVGPYNYLHNLIQVHLACAPRLDIGEYL